MNEMLTQAPSVASYVPQETAVMESPLPMPAPFTGDRTVEALRFAVEWFEKKPDWVTFFREVLGVGGVVRRLFSTPEQMAAFEQTEQYAEIQQMVARLREKKSAAVATTDDREPTRVITVRMPKSLHESLREEAQDKRTSMNQLCISKLLLVIDNDQLPPE